jgi:hypothetical protein
LHHHRHSIRSTLCCWFRIHLSLACFCCIDSLFICVVDCLSPLSIAATAVDTFSLRHQYSKSVPLPLILFLFVLVCLVVSIRCFNKFALRSEYCHATVDNYRLRHKFSKSALLSNRFVLLYLVSTCCCLSVHFEYHLYALVSVSPRIFDMLLLYLDSICCSILRPICVWYCRCQQLLLKYRHQPCSLLYCPWFCIVGLDLVLLH